ncbi:hypothetical protein DSO57_1036323 [Entomophthora muscae]|uniref:Uncharacterized protein n=1 Tax=Entomophthora muscae TaxID=34485 RepID=A0ACC2RQA7_9FUNG|nr:hypothetical protein DSO57_1036323 [Entomophthora muscae]
MSTHINSHTSLHQVYQNLMAGMMAKDCKAFIRMPHSSQARFLNWLLPASSRQLRAQDCDTTVAGLERDTVMNAEEEEGVDSIFAKAEASLIWLPCLGFEDL